MRNVFSRISSFFTGKSSEASKEPEGPTWAKLGEYLRTRRQRIYSAFDSPETRAYKKVSTYHDNADNMLETLKTMVSILEKNEFSKIKTDRRQLKEKVTRALDDFLLTDSRHYIRGTLLTFYLDMLEELIDKITKLRGEDMNYEIVIDRYFTQMLEDLWELLHSPTRG